MSDDKRPDPIPAATVVVMRDRDRAPPQLLFVERAKSLAFAGGAVVFPGGRIDPADRALAELTGLEESEGAARIAAIRETIEEAGIALGLDSRPGDTVLRLLRDGLHDGQPLHGLMRDHALTLELDALVPFARWCPKMAHARIFDTRFYLARLPDGSPEPEVDATENVRAFWATAEEMLAAADCDEARIIFPTRRNLERLARFASFADAVADARTHPIRTITPWIEERDDGRHLCIPDELGYPVLSEPLHSAFRG